MKFETPKEYGLHESQYGPPRRLTNSFKLQVPMDQKLREYARANRTDISVVIRHAMHEYFETRGINAFHPLGIN